MTERAAETDRIPLDLLPPEFLRKRAKSVAIGAVLVGAALGGLFGLVGGRTAGLVAAAVVAVPLLLLAWAESRRRCWLAGSELSVRALGTRTVDLAELTDITVLVADQRGVRTIGVLVQGGPRRRLVNVAVALYAGSGGRELGVYELRRLADALAATGDTRALVLSQLLVAQLRADARGEAAADRPLYQLASLVPAGRVPRRIGSDAVARFVAALD
ncbi:hypothetical protein [Actinoalloteichus spitiensis]|uniref:hypothetical protein n=1 Tax=Actinoalloteichus spitiensis TaxID=252394 RepID=UPI0003664ED4|nr:hypothetical protein [Actinoalloteichus spitiensis]